MSRCQADKVRGVEFNFGSRRFGEEYVQDVIAHQAPVIKGRKGSILQLLGSC